MHVTFNYWERLVFDWVRLPNVRLDTPGFFYGNQFATDFSASSGSFVTKTAVSMDVIYLNLKIKTDSGVARSIASLFHKHAND